MVSYWTTIAPRVEIHNHPIKLMNHDVIHRQLFEYAMICQNLVRIVSIFIPNIRCKLQARTGGLLRVDKKSIIHQ